MEETHENLANRKYWETLTKKNFPKVFKATWDSVTCLEIAARGFRRSGLFPLDPSAIDKTKLDPSKIANPVAVSQQANNTQISAPAQIELTNPLPSTSQQTTPTSPITIAVETPQTPKSNYMGISTAASQNPDTSQLSPGPSSPTIVSGSRVSTTHVSPAFQPLKVPKQKQRKCGQSINQKLPKALSGSVALKMFEERERKKEEESQRKEKRKEETERNRKEKEEKAKQRKEEMEERKRKREEQKLFNCKKSKESKKGRQRKESSSSSEEDENLTVHYIESDDDYDERNICPGCLTDDALTDPDEWIKCQNCPQSWHVSCTGDSVILEIPVDQLKNYPFYCEKCV